MVCVGNFCIDTSGWIGTALNISMIAIIFLIIFAIIGWIVYWWYQKGIFKYPITVTNVRENGSTKEVHGLKGGIVKGKGGIANFKIKIPKKLFKKSLGYVPNFSLADSDNRLHFIQIGDGTLWQQVDKKIMTERNIEIPVTELEIKNTSDWIINEIKKSYADKTEEFKSQIYEKSMENWINQRRREVTKQNLIMEPVPTDIKTVTINAIHDVQALTDKNKMTATIVGIIAFLIMAVVQIIFLYFTRKR